MKCLVCEIDNSKRPNNSPVCPACRKFFHRFHRRLAVEGSGSSTMRCLSGTNACNIYENSIAIGSGTFWRMACPKCRYDKCIAIGIGKYCRIYPKSEKLVQTQTSTIAQMSNNESQKAEQMLGQMVKVMLDLSASLISMPLLNKEIQQGGAYILAKHFDHGALAVSNFLQALPRYLNLKANERSILFTKVVGPITLLETNRLQPRLWSCSLDNAKHMLDLFPNFKAMSHHSRNVSLALSTWNPNTIEFACLLAFIVEQNCLEFVNGPKEDLSLTIGSYFSHGQLENARRVFEIVLEAERCRRFTIHELRQNCPDKYARLTSASGIFEEYDAVCRQLSSTSVDLSKA